MPRASEKTDVTPPPKEKHREPWEKWRISCFNQPKPSFFFCGGLYIFLKVTDCFRTTLETCALEFNRWKYRARAKPAKRKTSNLRTKWRLSCFNQPKPSFFACDSTFFNILSERSRKNLSFYEIWENSQYSIIIKNRW